MFFKKIWQGKASLGFTFWVLGVFMLFMMRVFEVATASISPASAKLGFLVSLGYFFFYSIVLWRTADNCDEDVKYAWLARMFILVGWARYFITAVLGGFSL